MENMQQWTTLPLTEQVEKTRLSCKLKSLFKLYYSVLGEHIEHVLA